ncbi:probable serine/threonine-protein kinase kinX [Impatiens glandulifera]|uniref:probable serine/threonine-protein kinase kinX n=1 Tax=Impatiens glandulifera TaxID=253017 RepID=UPI001FB06C0D|nr:probable serine/threonine-protein kinase kinX [Impatiens glandulifera]
MKDGKVEESVDAKDKTKEMELKDGKVEDSVDVKVEESVDAVKVEESVDVKVEESVVKVEESVDAVKVDCGENEKNVKVYCGEIENDVKVDGGEIEKNVKVYGGEIENDVKVDGGEMLLSDMMQEIIEKKKDKVKVKVEKVEKDAKDGNDKVKVKVEKDSNDGKDKVKVEKDGKVEKDKVKDAKDGNDDDDFQLYNTPPKRGVPKKKKNWLKDEATNDQKKTVYTCEAPKKLFVRVLTKCTRLKDPEVDAFRHLLRKRIAQYPKTYKHSKVSIGDFLLGDKLRREHPTFKKDLENYPIVDEFDQYFLGVDHRHMPECASVDDIYVPLNIGNKHWVLCVVRLQDNHIDVYDCDSSIYRNLDPYLRPLCEMIPRLFAMGATDAELQRFPNFNFQKLTYKRLPHPAKNAVAKVGEVPRAA